MSPPTYQPAKTYARISPGETVRMLRELQELSQAELAEKTGLRQSAISAMENGRAAVGLDRSKLLARALYVHPAVIAFSDWEAEESRVRKPARKTG